MGPRAVGGLPETEEVSAPKPEAPLLLYVAASDHAVSSPLIEEK
jgi:hypothetical protein